MTCVSSAEVYGEAEPGRLPFSEELSLAPVTPYGTSKAAMEIVCGHCARSRGLRIAVLRGVQPARSRSVAEFAAAGFARQVAEAELERPADPPLVSRSADRLREATGWQPRIPLSQTVADLLDFWRTKLADGG